MRDTAIISALALAGCASTYELTVMPRDSGRIYTGTAQDNGRGEGSISITIDSKAFTGTWIETQPAPPRVRMGGIGWGRRGFGGLGSFITMDNPQGGEAKASSRRAMAVGSVRLQERRGAQGRRRVQGRQGRDTMSRFACGQ